MLEKRKYSISLDVLLVFVLMALAFVVRYIYIGKSDVGNDECFSLYYSRFSTAEIMRLLTTGGDNPPLWEMILSVWIKIFGIELLSLRSLSLLFNVLTIIPLYKLSNKFWSREVALFTSLLYVFSSFSLFLSHDGRVYSLVGLLTVSSVYSFVKLCDKQEKLHWVILLISNVLIVYSHYMAAFWVMLIECMTIILFKDLRKSLWKGLLFLIVGMLILCSPLIPVVIERFMDSGVNGTWIKKCSSIEDFYCMMWDFTNAPVPVVFAALIMCSSLIKVVQSIKVSGFKYSPSLFVFVIWFVPLTASFLLSFLVGFFLNRYFYFALPFYLLTLSICINYLFEEKRLFRVLVYMCFLFGMIFSFKMDSSEMRYAGWKGDVSKVSNRLVELQAEKDAYVIISPCWIDKQLVYYFDDKHEIFATEGGMSEPVFSDYLKPRGYYYESDYHAEDYMRYSNIIIVHENWRDISLILRDLEFNGYEQENCEVFQQITITTFHRE